MAVVPISSDVQKTELERLLRDDLLTPLFQPIAALGAGEIFGYEGLIRGPSSSYLHSPLNLFAAADRCGMLPELDFACRRAVIRGFVKTGLPGRLFLNISPSCLTLPSFRSGATLEILRESGLSPRRVVIELTEIHPADNFEHLREALLHYREMGFRIALDDLGEGFSGLRLWSELQPDFVKIDKYFIQGIAGDPQKRQFVRSIHHIALNTGARVIAEGIETQHELETVRRIGIDLVQGYHLARPQANPPRKLDIVVRHGAGRGEGIGQHTARSLLIETPTAQETQVNDQIYQLFSEASELHALPVLDAQGIPLGLLKRHEVLERFARPFNRELYGQRLCTMLMDPTPLIVEHSISLEELSRLVTSCDRRYLADGFIITEGGRYLGMGAGHDLMRMITDMQIRAARHANPLTLLPGNVPIQEEIQRLLVSNRSFVAVYADLDHFKPYNDIYGYDKGDEIIQALGAILQNAADPSIDFVGHIGGDDFLLLLLSEDWRARCIDMLEQFNSRIKELFLAEHIESAGYSALDRQGNSQWHPLVSLSLGAVVINPDTFGNHHEIAVAAAAAKKMAKQQAGSSLFVERRRLDGQSVCVPTESRCTSLAA